MIDKLNGDAPKKSGSALQKGLLKCKIDPNGGPITVRLNAHNLIRAVGTFALFDAAGRDRGNNWTMEPGDPGSCDYKLEEVLPKTLYKNQMKWIIICCSTHPDVDEATISIQIFQDGKEMTLSHSAQWDLKQIPYGETCTDPAKVEDLLFFVYK